MRRLGLQEAFSLGRYTSFHLFIKDRILVDSLLNVLEEKRIFWKSDKKPTELKDFMYSRLYPIVLTVSKSPERSYMTYADGVADPSSINSYWARYPTEGYVLVDAELAKVKIKRKDKI